MSIFHLFSFMFKLTNSIYVYQTNSRKQNFQRYYKISNKHIPEIAKYFETHAENEKECLRKCNQDSANCNAMNVFRESSTRVICHMFIDNGKVQESSGQWYITKRRPVQSILFDINPKDQHINSNRPAIIFIIF